MITIGSHVALNSDLHSLFPSMAKVIFEVVDSRIQNRRYTFTLRRVTTYADRGERIEGFSANDLHVVGQ